MTDCLGVRGGAGTGRNDRVVNRLRRCSAEREADCGGK